MFFSSVTGRVVEVGTTALEKVDDNEGGGEGGGMTVTVSVCRASTTRTITAFTTVSVVTCSVGEVCPRATGEVGVLLLGKREYEERDL